MKLREWALRLGGKLVGRVGVEPTTKRLRAYLPNAENIEKTRNSSLIDELNCTSKAPSFSRALRGSAMSRGARLLIGLGLLAALLALSAWTASNEPLPPPIDYCPPHDSGNPWCIR